MAVAATEKMFDALGRALSYIACVLDTEAFVIGGGVSKAGNYLLEGIRRHYREAAFHGVKDAEFVLATLGNDAGIFGAAKMICDACRAIKEETE